MKHGTNSANTGSKLLGNDKIDYLVFFKGITQLHRIDRQITLPIWLSPLFDYNVDGTVKKDPLEQLNLF